MDDITSPLTDNTSRNYCTHTRLHCTQAISYILLKFRNNLLKDTAGRHYFVAQKQVTYEIEELFP